MRSRSPVPVLTDIKRNIDLAYSFVAGLSFEAFRADRRTVYAVTRCLEIISRRLPSEAMARRAQIPWTDRATAGNVYRHEYEEVLDSAIWRTVKHSLEPLRAVVETELGRFTQKDG